MDRVDVRASSARGWEVASRRKLFTHSEELRFLIRFRCHRRYNLYVACPVVGGFFDAKKTNI